MQRRATTTLTAKLERNLFVYATAATAAGIGILASPEQAEAKVIFTPANVVIGTGGLDSYALDVNNDGLPDFVISQIDFEAVCDFSGHRARFWFLQETPEHGAVAAPNSSAYALYAGAVIDSKLPFREGREVMAFSFNGVQCQDDGGNWDGVTRRFLGLKFDIQGKTHYGWARFNVRHVFHAGFHARLTGYAYQTVADRRIIAGNHGHSQPAGLGHMALGAAGRKQGGPVATGH